VLKKNMGLEVLQQVDKILQGRSADLPEGLEPSEIAVLKYCPITSVDVERSFSQFKNVFTERRHGFTEENLAKHVICNCFYGRGH